MVDYSNQVVLITGAAAGIGRQLALEFARRGASIAAIDLAAGPLEQLIADLQQAGATGKFGWAVADVSVRPAVHEAIKTLQTQVGHVDIVIANAGIGIENPIRTFRAEVFEKQVAVNLIGIANTLEPVLPGLIDRRQGHIITLSSLASYRGLPMMAGYCASKAGASAFMDSLRVELKPYNIHCTTICPSFIETNMTKELAVPTPGGMLTVETAVSRMMRAIERKQPYFAFPLRNHFLLVLGRLMPTWLGDYLTMQKMGKVVRKHSSPDAPPRQV